MNRREAAQPLAVLKALGDETRYAMYEELARSTAALSASDLAERLGIELRQPTRNQRQAGRVVSVRALD